MEPIDFEEIDNLSTAAVPDAHDYTPCPCDDCHYVGPTLCGYVTDAGRCHELASDHKSAPSAHQAEPLPCPWCGSKPTVRSWSKGGQSWFVTCNNPVCYVQPELADIKKSREEAISTWNTRSK